MAFYDATDAAVFYEIIGDGQPVMFLHGYALNSQMWEFQKPVIAAHFKMITVDLRGFGQSSCSGRWCGDVMADDVAGLIKYLNLQNVTIIGFSMSGPVALRLAISYPDTIAKLVMVSSILPSPGRPRRNSQGLAQKRELDILTLQGVEAWAEKIGLKSGPLVGNIFKRNPDARELWEKMLKRHNPEFLRCMMQAREHTPPSENWRAKLRQVSQPTLIIAGAQDDRFLDASRYMHRAIPNARLEIIHGAGHMVNLEKPEEFNKALLTFLQGQ